MNFSYSPLLRDFTKATNIRLRFLRTNTLLGHLMGKALRDPTVTRRVSERAGLLSHFSCVRLCATPEMAAHQAPLSLGFSRQEHWSGLPFPSPMHESEK